MKRLTTAYMVAFFIFLVLGSEAYGGKTSTLMHIRATIPPQLNYSILHEPAALEITDENTEDKDKENERNNKHEEKKNRELKIKDGTILSVDTNTTEGYILSVQSLPSNVFISVKIKVEGNGPKFRLSPGGSVEVHIPYSGKSHDVLSLSYKFYLSPGVDTGVYPWPILVTVHLL